jgi:hypothetical protein
VEPGTRKELGDADLAERGKCPVEHDDELPDEVREAVDRLGHPDERRLAVVVKAAHPVGDRLLGDLKPPGSLGNGPSSRGAERVDGEARRRRIVRASLRGEVPDARSKDAGLFLVCRNLGERDIALSDEADASDATVEAPSSDMCRDEVREGERVDRSAARVLRPCTRERDVGEAVRRPEIEAQAGGAGHRRAGSSSRDARRDGGDALDDGGEVLEHGVLREAEHCPAELGKRFLPNGILPLAPLVVATIDLNDEAHLGASEVDDEVSDDELPAEAEACLRSGEPPPEPLLCIGPSSVEARKDVRNEREG